MKFLVNILLILIIAGGNSFLHGKSTFSADRIKSACEAYIKDNLGGNAEVSFMQAVKDQQFAEDDVSASISSDPGRLKGICRIKLAFTKDNVILREYEVSLRIRIIREMAVAARTIRSGEKISAGDYEIRPVDVAAYSESELIQPAELDDATAARIIPSGTVFTRTLLGNPRLIRKGDKVIIVVISGAVRIRTTGFAMQDASAGETIKIKYNGSILTGRAAMDGSIVLAANESLTDK